jgi:hypothetical protein
MSAEMRKRLEGLEGMAARQVADGYKRPIGRDIRTVATECGVPCWPEGRDAEWREWSRQHASPELRVVLAEFHDAITRRAEELGMSVSDEERLNPWRDEGDSA